MKFKDIKKDEINYFNISDENVILKFNSDVLHEEIQELKNKGYRPDIINAIYKLLQFIDCKYYNFDKYSDDIINANYENDCQFFIIDKDYNDNDDIEIAYDFMDESHKYSNIKIAGIYE